MKIVNVILTSQNGGAEQVFLDYILVLKKLGHEVSAIIKNDAPYESKVQKLCKLVGKTSNNFGFYDFIAVGNIKKFLKEFDADVVFVHSGRSTILVRKAVAKIKDKKIFVVSINHSMNVKRSIGCDLVLSVNKEIFFRTIERGQSEDRSFVVHNATDVSDAFTSALAIDLSRKEKIVIGVIGRLDEIKSFEFAILAIKKLQQKSDKKFLLKIAGSGPKKAFLHALVKDLQLEDSVEFLSWVQDKKSFFESIDIFCLTSRRETFGLVLLEAMKFCKPIISTNCDGPREIVRNDLCALLIDIEPLTSIDDRIADAVIRIINDPEFASKIVANSLQKVCEKFSYQALEKRLVEIVGTILTPPNNV
ncbi:MAG: hypothetical protein A2887_02010 [Alphaproteobacteria bacterium RIFCSPLOWO2_01_FULL_40_26]|nr:MAG: hypothetical protein A3D15_00140 [Alphaproteobacteria bacterium RIFCSPHIGHO2_02_FULL_40_34]OFW87165.1 MAG: hypothetical protein A2794_05460 [Alphaproteobacteria bacterium RIFCSPHIGHO2_01_FULL_40_8]OFW93968.1 MAG: hypothetical protein A2887_02010 [Alphaproteobacteria bacterium RIFCSPLOWO2_01_FULL_40_26]OFX09680.1 MAG: hypothetical protein A3H30_03365 [Alphaproteobacteria bacterium RIFCSPLOWO2_02_FULL_40_19]OFX10829.1 MAG: hypothetical protein A3G22_00430 [Alphaproteobacteria bacterium RI